MGENAALPWRVWQGTPQCSPLSDDRKPRGGFGYDFEYVLADLDIAGQKFPQVGLRFKGNSTYMLTSSYLKRPFKIDLDRTLSDQAWLGLKKLVLNNNVMDPSITREPLAYALYRAAGVPAPRTGLLELTLTVPGKYDRTVVGVYSLIEPIDKAFLKRHYGSGKGMLLKPENIPALAYLGENWSTYQARYRPKSDTTPQQQRRLIDFTRLVHQAPDEQFRRQIGDFLDLDRFLRYVAATSVLSSMDSFVGLGHNYYLYLDPKTDRFSVLPWDLDHAFGALTMVGSAADLQNLSLRRPYPGQNRLLERLLADETHYATYRQHVARLLKETFTLDWVRSQSAQIAKTIAAAREREKKAIADRREGWNSWKMLEVLNPPPSPEKFTTLRIASLESQLAGKSTGTVLRGRPPSSGGMERALVRPTLQQADRDNDGQLSRDEVVTGLRKLFETCAGPGTTAIDQKRLTAGLEKIVPQMPAGRGPAGFVSPAAAIALSRGIFALAGKDGQLTADALVAAGGKLFDQADADKSGKLDSRELTSALKTVLTPPPPADPTKARG
ncbi:MAG: CotH kinase family protein [Gemmataceae bacterium]